MNQHDPRLPAAALIAFLLCGCSSTPPAHQAEPAIVDVLGLGAPIAFQTEGGALNEPGNDPGTLGLSEAVYRAVSTDPELQAALARVRIALAEAKQARLLPNPVLNLAFRFPEGSGKPIVEASLMQDIIAVLRIPRQASAADNRLRQAAADALITALDIVDEVEERYATLQSIEELMPVLQKRRDLLSRLLDQESSKLAAGESTRQDVSTLYAQRIELEVEIADRERERRDEQLRLARLVGQPSSAAAWTVEPWSPPKWADLPEVSWIDAALTRRPEVQSAAWKLAALGDEAALAKLLPWDGTSVGVASERDEAWTVGPSLDIPIPIFDMGQARSERVVAEQIEARHELTLAKRKVVEDVRRAYDSLGRTESNLRRVREELIPLQEQRRSLAEVTFRNGQTDITPLFLAEQDLQSALAKAVDLERETTVALIHLNRAVGGAGVAAALASSPTSTPSTSSPTPPSPRP